MRTGIVPGGLARLFGNNSTRTSAALGGPGKSCCIYTNRRTACMPGLPPIFSCPPATNADGGMGRHRDMGSGHVQSEQPAAGQRPETAAGGGGISSRIQVAGTSRRKIACSSARRASVMPTIAGVKNKGL